MTDYLRRSGRRIWVVEENSDYYVDVIEHVEP